LLKERVNSEADAKQYALNVVAASVYLSDSLNWNIRGGGSTRPSLLSPETMH